MPSRWAARSSPWRRKGSGGATSAFPLSLRVENALVSYARYLGKAVWPTHLALFYPHPGAAASWQVYGSLLLLLAITFFAVESKRRYLIVGWLWFLGTLVPMIGLMQVGMQSMADRYAYLSFIGLFITVCWGAVDFSESKHVPASAMTAIASSCCWR